MLKYILSIAAILMVMAGCSQSMQELGGKNNPALADGENDYFKNITVANLTEIETSKIALAQSDNPAVRSFAEKMINDHDQAESKVSAVAKEKGVMLPVRVDENHQKMIDDLRDTHGADFDKAYADLQITAHKQTIHLDQAEIDSGLDQQVRQLATDLMPTLQMHLKLAEQLKSGL